MKRIIASIFLFLLLASLPTFAIAEDTTAETEETAETQDETEETEEAETSLVEIYRAKELPKGWKTQKTLEVDTEDYTEIYNCPVRKCTVYMKFKTTWGPSDLRVWIQVLKDGKWMNAANMEGLDAGETIVFVFDEPYRYRIVAKALEGGFRSNKCRFRFVGLA